MSETVSAAVLPREAFRHCPRCANLGNSAPPEATWFDCAACGFRFHFNAAVSASALIVRHDEQMFFIRRAREPATGKLAYPGGFVDPFETAEEALARETVEEVGMNVREIAYLGSFVNPYTYRGILYPVLDLFFTVRVEGETATLAPDEVTDAFWCNPSDVNPEEIAFPSMRNALRLYLTRLGNLR